MHARVSTYQSSDPQGLIEGFRSITDALEQVEGFSHAYFLVDPSSGQALSITLWQSQEALEASVAKADELRRQGTQPSGAAIESVQHYEVPVTAGTPARA